MDLEDVVVIKNLETQHKKMLSKAYFTKTERWELCYKTLDCKQYHSTDLMM